MATKPGATVSINANASALAGGTGYVVIMSPVSRNADLTPRVYSSFKGILDQHDYSPGADYAALHIEEDDKPVIFIGMPIATPGVLGRVDATHVTGSSVISVAAAASGYLEEVNGKVRVTKAGTVGTNGIELAISMDGGLSEKKVQLGTATSYTVPYLGIVVSFAPGTLAVDDYYTFTTTAPMWDSAGVAAARAALQAQQKLARSWMVMGDCATDTVAGYVLTEVNAYATSKKRFTLARVSVRDRLPQAALSKPIARMTGSPTLTFAEVGATGDTITRSAGSWITDGFAVGDVIAVTGSASNNVTGPIAALSATVITLGTTDLAAEVAAPNCAVVGSPGLVFAEVGATADTITRSRGSWFDDGFRVGDNVTVAGTASNNVTGPIAVLTATVLTFDTTDLAAETIGSKDVTITTGETMAAWVSAMDAEFAPINAQPRIDTSLGRGTKTSPITKWILRRPASWAASLREYQRDIHIPTWRKEDGPLDGFGLEDAHGNVVEYDEDNNGGALAGRFTCLRTWGNGPEGTFVAMSLTRDTDASILSLTHNMYVANAGCTIVQTATENVVGKVLQKDADGHAFPDALGRIEESVNTDLAIGLLQEKVPGQGPRASSAVWKANTTDDFNSPSAKLTGVMRLVLNGTVVEVETLVDVR